MLLKTRVFGEIEVKKEEIIKFTEPIVGFDRYRRFVLLERASLFPMFWLQSIDNPSLAFPVVTPFSFDEKYSIGLHNNDLEDLNFKKVEDILVLTLLVVPQDVSDIRTNLRAPILYNTVNKLAKQIVLREEKYPIHFYIMKNQI